MYQTIKVNCVLAREKDTEAGDKMLGLWNDIEELHRQARINRKLLKVKMGKLQNLRKEYPNVGLYTDYIEYDDYDA